MSLLLTNGRRSTFDSVDHSVGIARLLPVGAQVKAGEALALVHARSEADAEQAAAAIQSAYTLGETKPPMQKAVIRRIGARV